MVVKILVVRHDVEVNTKDHDGRSPLSYAAEYERGGGEDAWLAGRRQGDTMDEAGRSPLSCAAEEGHEPVVKLLVTRRCRGGLQGQPGPFAAI